MYDFLFITNIPSFYKLNLYNELAKKCNIYVIFLSAGSKVRQADFFNGEMLFDYKIIDQHAYEQRNWFLNGFKLLKLMRSINYFKVVVGGWDAQEYWLTILTNRKKKNAVVVESSIHDSTPSGIKGYIKRFFVSRLSIAFVSGIGHKQLLEALNFSGNVIVTGGVGLINKNGLEKIDNHFNGRFLYVGRLSVEKNLFFLINAFKNFPDFYLTILGHGPLEEKLKEIAGNNVKFIANIPNDEIQKIYLQHDVLLLLSHSEPWGLVVEEALFYGLPVILSNQVGCIADLLVACKGGLIVDTSSKDSLKKALQDISELENYKKLHKSVSLVDFDKRFTEQVNSYLNTIKKI
ncbi:glycosyltransferase [sulfur-oxidizing endosymbiont of Gigantopelta aegis]|uniref:glycosyltransferase n=1 Tax=sulfur-oxidizing endosymbiont of Gigantopelta aegis TaxID=2794934 RepID=UPI001BE4C284|nr:glycosyltransferase [sulfur-oxidizing endosymbiont of Gigantopelta aegis]